LSRRIEPMNGRLLAVEHCGQGISKLVRGTANQSRDQQDQKVSGTKRGVANN